VTSRTAPHRSRVIVKYRKHLRALGAVALAAVVACGGSGEAEETEGATETASAAVSLGPQDVAVVQESELAAGVILTGSLEPAEVVPITAQVAGTMGEIRVDRGTPVRRGQLMATIQAAGVRSQAAGARAGVAAAEANLAVARQRRDAARRLHEAGAMSAIEARSAESAYEAAEAQLAAARGQAAAANESASHTTINAPITGVVSARAVEPGQPVAVGDPILTVVNSDVLELSAQVSVAEAARVEIGAPVIFTLTGQPDQEYRGTVARKDPVADPATRQVGVYVRLPNEDGRVVGGQFARGRILTGGAEQSLVVPTAAVRGQGDSTYVLVVEGGTGEQRNVAVGARDETAGVVAVQSGLRSGERVITTPGAGIAPGTAVEISGDTVAVGE
jgi:RND family efflux transporter MFP subunit